MNTIQSADNGFQYHPELSSITLRSIDAVRINDTSPEWLTRWGEDLEKATTEYNILAENMDNIDMDENRFAIGEIEAAAKRIINAYIRQEFQAKTGRQEWVTLLECVCANRTAILPLIIFM